MPFKGLVFGVLGIEMGCRAWGSGWGNMDQHHRVLQCPAPAPAASCLSVNHFYNLQAIRINPNSKGPKYSYGGYFPKS